MSVGKESIKRAASTSTATTAATAATTTKKTTAKKTTTTKKAAVKPAAAKPAEVVEPVVEEVKTSVLTPMDADEVQAKFLSEAPVNDKYRPVRVTEAMPVHLL